MLVEIDRDFYCSAGAYARGADISWCELKKTPCYTRCKCYHRKWPTPEQFEEEYGFMYPDDWAVYLLRDEWILCAYDDLGVGYHRKIGTPIVCACTPWGKPPGDWRPE